MKENCIIVGIVNYLVIILANSRISFLFITKIVSYDESLRRRKSDKTIKMKGGLAV